MGRASRRQEVESRTGGLEDDTAGAASCRLGLLFLELGRFGRGGSSRSTRSLLL